MGGRLQGPWLLGRFPPRVWIWALLRSSRASIFDLCGPHQVTAERPIRRSDRDRVTWSGNGPNNKAATLLKLANGTEEPLLDTEC